jgi:hypothetical protein
MGDARPKLADRLAELTPVQREQHLPAVVLCELLDELVEATREQSALLRAALGQHDQDQAGQTRGAGDTAGAAAPSAPAEGDDKGGAQVQLREPGLPPADPDPEPARTDRPVAEPSADTKPANRRTAAKTTAAKKAAPAKTATATREGRQQ